MPEHELAGIRIRLTGSERLALLIALQDLIEVEGGNKALSRVYRKLEARTNRLEQTG